MHTSASVSMPYFDASFQSREKIFQENPITGFQGHVANNLDNFAGKTLLSMTNLHERLNLLAQLELPCNIVITNPRLNLRRAIITRVQLQDEALSIEGEGFNLHLRGPNIHSIWLVNRGEAEHSRTSLDIQHSPGMLYASIQSAPDGLGEAVWRDIMENLTLSLS